MPDRRCAGDPGRPWSLLAARECSDGVHRRFTGIQRSTGAATDILASRLKRLQAAGILRREPCSSRPVRYEYVLTGSGQELFPILPCPARAGQASPAPRHAPLNPAWHSCGAEIHIESACQACRELVTPQDLRCR